MIKYIIFFLTAACTLTNCSIQQKQIKQIRIGLISIPSTCDFEKNRHLCKELAKSDKKYRELILEKVADYIQNCDTIIFIEERRSNIIGYHRCYIYFSNKQQVKIYETDIRAKKPNILENKTYTLQELKKTKINLNRREMFPNHYSEEIIMELMKPPPFNMRDIIFSIQENSLDSCLIEINKQRFTPSSSYKILIALKIGNNYIVQHFSDWEYRQ